VPERTTLPAAGLASRLPTAAPAVTAAASNERRNEQHNFRKRIIGDSTWRS
jgi:hypothetical protein